MEYWEKRFSIGGKIWGDRPAKSALQALKLFEKRSIETILIPGSGYGRNTKLFADNGYDVEGIEVSNTAINIAKSFDPKTRFLKGSILNMPFSDEKFDAIFCFNVLHLFEELNRVNFIKKCYLQLKNGGFAYFTVFSEKEKSYGKGKQTEFNTYESKPERPVHYFTKEDLKRHFRSFEIIKMGLIKERENHGESGKHVHVLRFIFVKKERSK